MPEAPAVFIGLGSNLGDREEALAHGRRALEAGGFRIDAASSLYETEPMGGPPQDWFLNQVIGGETFLSPEALLAACLAAEQEQGRVRTVPGGPRTFDADLLLYGDELRQDRQLTLPHPRLHQRRFVLVPLVEVAPAARHPRLGLTAQELLARCPDRSQVRRYSLAVRP
jgi:2-amino-4-hydroxy-6-hydroxymethyldihydropteridine diphosphokinase